ncbi:MAG TPA: tetratricopeptide repeat protein, partial [Candidatus Tectomicrobia bacterium]
MSPPVTLSARGEETWLSLRYHVEWAEGFALIVLFSSNPALYGLLRERLANIYRTRVSHLQQVTPQSAATLSKEIMALIRAPSELYVDAAAPLWLDLAAGKDTAWEQARDNLVARLNEHRDLLRQRWRCPVLLLLPAGYRQHLRELAPDLWSIRDFSLDLDELEIMRYEGDTPFAGHLITGMYNARDTASSLPQVPTSFDAAQWLEWERLQQSGATSREMLLAGWRAVDAALSARQLQRAVQVAADVLKISREMRVQEGDTPETVRDLSIALDNVGRVAVALGQWAEAETTCRESLALRRQQRERLGDTPETVRDLSIALNNVGRVVRALGQWAEAETAYRESLALRRQQRERLGDTPETVRDLSIALDNVGRVAEALGQWPEAETAYRE